MAKRRKGAGDKSASSSPAPASYPRYAAGSAEAQQDHTEGLLDIEELLVDEGALDLQGLLCLGRCSKACSSATAALLHKCAFALLTTAVKQTTDFQGNDNNDCKLQSTKAVTKLLQRGADKRVDLSRFTAPTAAAHFVSISNVPQQVAKELLQAGLRFSFEQIMQGVRARTAGVEVWVSTTAAVGLEAALHESLPPWMRMLCDNPLEVVSSSARCSNMLHYS
jgi:hypothetical protein